MPETMMASIIDTYGKDPYLILVSCLLSLRARDTQTLPVCHTLFKKVRSPQGLLTLPLSELESILYSLGFYKQKAKTLKSISLELINRFNGIVPHTEEKLLSIKGIGRKTANLILASAFEIPAICVDVHVHRIANMLGMVNTKTPHETEIALRQLLPKDRWTECNSLFVKLGQNVRVSDILSIFNKIETS